MNRLNQLKEYLRLAQLKPLENRLYIEDLEQSILIEERKPQPYIPTVRSGFVDAFDNQS